MERDFLVDQRQERKIAIGGVDIQTTTKMKRRLDRKFNVGVKKKLNEETAFTLGSSSRFLHV